MLRNPPPPICRFPIVGKRKTTLCVMGTTGYNTSCCLGIGDLTLIKNDLIKHITKFNQHDAKLLCRDTTQTLNHILCGLLLYHLQNK
jgi:hypothetical protein